MGLMSPVFITGKLIFQDSWCKGVGTTWEHAGAIRLTPTGSGHPHSKMGGGQGKRKLSNPRLLRRIREGVWGCALHPVNPQDENLGADCMQQEQAGCLKESYPPDIGAYSGFHWSTLAALLLQRNGSRHRGSNIVVRFNRGFGMDM